MAKRMNVASDMQASTNAAPRERRYRGARTWPRRLRHPHIKGILEREGVLAHRDCPQRHQYMAISNPLDKGSNHFRQR